MRCGSRLRRGSWHGGWREGNGAGQCWPGFRTARECTASTGRPQGGAPARADPRTPTGRSPRPRELAEPVSVSFQEVRLAADPGARVRDPPADPDPLRGLLEEQVADGEEPRDPEAERVTVKASRRDLDRRDRAVIGGQAELDEGELVVPAQQLPV